MKRKIWIIGLIISALTLFGLARNADAYWLTKVKNWLIVDSQIENCPIGAVTPAEGTFTTLEGATVDINGGTIDGATIDNTTIGIATPSTGDFTTLSATTAATITSTTTADSYATPLAVTWTAGADMTSGGSNGIYIHSLVNEDVLNVYGHRSRIDLRSASGTIAANQLHAFDGLINLDNGAMTVIDNISAVGVAVYSVGITAGDITVAGGGYGSFNGMRVLWGAEEDFTIETNGLLIETASATNCDYGVNVYNDGTMDAGIWLHNNPNGGDTMVSDLKLSSGARVFTGSAANGDAVYAEVGSVDATGSIYITTAGAMYVQVANTGAATDWFKVTTTDAD